MDRGFDSYDGGEQPSKRFTALTLRFMVAGLSVAMFAAFGTYAQQAATGDCSPARTESLKSEKQLPAEPAPFGGVIKRDARESTPCWAPRMLVTQGGRFGGYGFYMMKGKPVFVWNLVDLKRVRWEGADTIPAGKHTLEFDFKYEGLGMETLAFGSPSGIGRGGTGVLKVDGKTVSTQSMQQSIPFILQWDENFDIGADTGTPVDDEYEVPFPFNGKIDKLTLRIERPQLTPADIEKLKEAQRNNRVSE